MFQTYMEGTQEWENSLAHYNLTTYLVEHLWAQKGLNIVWNKMVVNYWNFLYGFFKIACIVSISYNLFVYACLHCIIVPQVLWSLLMLHTEGCRMCESFVVCEQMLRGQEVWRLHDGICRWMIKKVCKWFWHEGLGRCLECLPS